MGENSDGDSNNGEGSSPVNRTGSIRQELRHDEGPSRQHLMARIETLEGQLAQAEDNVYLLA